ncbi:hypothetical protein [Blastococcus sp. TF02-09]|uniref:hypothetical protein n=1 Tax=Blastococcus sp. TF02-09 TaxID=2250576 RepID=UPI00131451BE|nr:hypothetical protein [Blastococcus sp. TF02-9]
MARQTMRDGETSRSASASSTVDVDRPVTDEEVLSLGREIAQRREELFRRLAE